MNHDGAVNDAELTVEGRHRVPDVDHSLLSTSRGQNVAQVTDVPELGIGGAVVVLEGRV